MNLFSFPPPHPTQRGDLGVSGVGRLSVLRPAPPRARVLALRRGRALQEVRRRRRRGGDRRRAQVQPVRLRRRWQAGAGANDAARHPADTPAAEPEVRALPAAVVRFSGPRGRGQGGRGRRQPEPERHRQGAGHRGVGPAGARAFTGGAQGGDQAGDQGAGTPGDRKRDPHGERGRVVAY